MGSSSGSFESNHPGISADTTNTSVGNLTGSGTIMAYTPESNCIIFRREASTAPVKYYYNEKTVLVDSEGHTLAWTALRPDMPVTYTYLKEGGRMIVTKVTLAARLAVETKETETTTTTR